MQHILVATDFSERSDRALRRATLLAKGAGARLTLLSVVDDDRPRHVVDTERREAEALIRRMARTVTEADGVACEGRVSEADAFVGIAAATADLEPDLLVIGPHRRQELNDVFLGSTAEPTIRTGRSPVLMANAPPAGDYRHILMTTDLSEVSLGALRRFMELGLAEAAPRRSVLNVYDALALNLTMAHTMTAEQRAFHLMDEGASAARSLAGFMESLGGPWAEQVIRHEKTTAAVEILDAAHDLAADLIVLAARSKSGVERLLLGSVAENVLRAAGVDVLVLPTLASD